LAKLSVIYRGFICCPSAEVKLTCIFSNAGQNLRPDFNDLLHMSFHSFHFCGYGVATKVTAEILFEVNVLSNVVQVYDFSNRGRCDSPSKRSESPSNLARSQSPFKMNPHQVSMF